MLNSLLTDERKVYLVVSSTEDCSRDTLTYIESVRPLLYLLFVCRGEGVPQPGFYSGSQTWGEQDQIVAKIINCRLTKKTFVRQGNGSCNCY